MNGVWSLGYRNSWLDKYLTSNLNNSGTWRGKQSDLKSLTILPCMNHCCNSGPPTCFSGAADEDRDVLSMLSAKVFVWQSGSMSFIAAGKVTYSMCYSYQRWDKAPHLNIPAGTRPLQSPTIRSDYSRRLSQTMLTKSFDFIVAQMT